MKYFFFVMFSLMFSLMSSSLANAKGGFSCEQKQIINLAINDANKKSQWSIPFLGLSKIKTMKSDSEYDFIACFSTAKLADGRFVDIGYTVRWRDHSKGLVEVVVYNRHDIIRLYGNDKDKAALEKSIEEEKIALEKAYSDKYEEDQKEKAKIIAESKKKQADAKLERYLRIKNSVAGTYANKNDGYNEFDSTLVVTNDKNGFIKYQLSTKDVNSGISENLYGDVPEITQGADYFSTPVSTIVVSKDGESIYYKKNCQLELSFSESGVQISFLNESEHSRRKINCNRGWFLPFLYFNKVSS